MLVLYLEAPFAVCRTFTAGWYRPTATFLTPSAAYGLVLNVAGIESRLREDEPGHDGKTPATLIRTGLPAVRLALGAPAFSLRGRAQSSLPEERRFPRVQTLFQQLHNYPVGQSAKERAASTMGNKYNITPVRRECLSDLRSIIALEGNTELERQIRDGLLGQPGSQRYGVVFVGDNQFLPNRLEELALASLALGGGVHWFERVIEASPFGPRPRTTRLTTWIDRAEMSKTQSALFAPTTEPTAAVPAAAWTEILPPAALPEPPPKKRSHRSK